MQDIKYSTSMDLKIVEQQLKEFGTIHMVEEMVEVAFTSRNGKPYTINEWGLCMFGLARNICNLSKDDLENAASVGINPNVVSFENLSLALSSAIIAANYYFNENDSDIPDLLCESLTLIVNEELRNTFKIRVFEYKRAYEYQLNNNAPGAVAECYIEGIGANKSDPMVSTLYVVKSTHLFSAYFMMFVYMLNLAVEKRILEVSENNFQREIDNYKASIKLLMDYKECTEEKAALIIDSNIRKFTNLFIKNGFSNIIAKQKAENHAYMKISELTNEKNIIVDNNQHEWNGM